MDLGIISLTSLSRGASCLLLRSVSKLYSQRIYGLFLLPDIDESESFEGVEHKFDPFGEGSGLKATERLAES